jgi:putative transcriptional regulator
MTGFGDIAREAGRAAPAAMLAATLAATACAPVTPAAEGPARAVAEGIAGRLLVAAADMPDPRFARSVIFVVRHDDNGAMGLVVNHAIGSSSVAKLLEGSGIDAGDGDGKVRIHYGGPVQPERGLVLHTPDFAIEGTVAITDGVSITANPRILRSIAAGKGPRQSLFALGYAGWAPGQLERELERKDWVVVPSDGKLVFDTDMGAKWRRAMARHGIDL